MSASHAAFSSSLITPAEAAQLLGVTPGTLAVWRSTGRYALAFVKIGARVKYRREDLAAFITQRTRAPALRQLERGGY
jgi:excisionase family DNA binding protein